MGDRVNGYACDAFIRAFADDIVRKYRSPLLDQTFGDEVGYYVAADDNWEVHLYARVKEKIAKDGDEHEKFFHFRVESGPAFFPTSDDIVEQMTHVFPELDEKEVERRLARGREESDREGVRLLRQFTADAPEGESR